MKKITKIVSKTKNILEEKEQKALNNIIINNNKEVNDQMNLQKLKEFMSQRTITFIKNLKKSVKINMYLQILIIKKKLIYQKII